MHVIRPVTPNDLDAIETFAFSTAPGMLSLPKDRQLLKKKIEKSLASFAKKAAPPGEEFYFFLLENLQTEEKGGSCGIYAKTGITEPNYYFEIKTEKMEKSALPLLEEVKLLYPLTVFDGPSELGALYLSPEWRKEKLGQLLSLSRLLFIADHRQRVTDAIDARLRGYIEKDRKTSPFWNGLGKHFLDLTFVEVQALIDKNVDFIPIFFPKEPIYACLLPQRAQRVMQKTHPSTRPALKMLRKEGFAVTNRIDPFEGGPVVEAKTDALRTVRKSVRTRVAGTTMQPIHSPQYIISNTKLDYRACYTQLTSSKEGVLLPQEVAEALNVKPGDPIRYVETQK